MARQIVGLRPGWYTARPGVLRAMIREIAEKLVYFDKDFHCLVTGSEGVGKSTAAYHLARKLGEEVDMLIEDLLGPQDLVPTNHPLLPDWKIEERRKVFEDTKGVNRFRVENVSWTSNQHRSKNEKAPPGSVFILDEVVSGAFNRDAATKENKDLIRYLIVNRVLNTATFYNVPDRYSADLYLRDHRATLLVHIPRTGIMELSVRQKDKHQTEPYWKDIAVFKFPAAKSEMWQEILRLKRLHVSTEGMGERSSTDTHGTSKWGDSLTYRYATSESEAARMLRAAQKLLVAKAEREAKKDLSPKGFKDFKALKPDLVKSRDLVAEAVRNLPEVPGSSQSLPQPSSTGSE